MVRRLLLLALLLAAALPARALETGFELPASPAPGTSLLLAPVVLQSSTISAFGDTASHRPKHRKARAAATETTHADGLGLGPERARVLLRSLTIPGWGQATLGHRHAAAFFAVTELGIWTAFAAFEVQQVMRRETFERTARIFAGIDVRGRDDEYQRIVGAFGSSDDYNLYVVARDAANLYLTDPTRPNMAGYRAYIAKHSLTGADAWRWSDYGSFLRYRGERKDAERAALRANTALGLAIANRLLSMLHAAREAGHASTSAHPTSFQFDVSPAPLDQSVALRAGLSTRF